jgi:peptidyl-prolyl cis-trans isomerase D
VPSVGVWAFSGAPVGATSDLVDSDDGYYLARLDSLTPGGLPPYESVKPAVRKIVAAQKALGILEPRAESFAQLAARTSLQQAADSLHLKVVRSPAFTPTSLVPDVGQLNQAVGAAFTLPVGVISAPIKTSEGVFVIRVDRRVPADRAAWEKQKTDQRQTLLRTLRQQRVQSYMEDLRQSAKITDNRAAVEAASRRSSAT